MRGAAGLISVSHSLRERVIAQGVDPQKVLVVPNAVDRSIFAPGDRCAARARLNLPLDELLIVSVGHLLSVKRHTVLLDALAMVRKSVPATLVIIGGPSYEAGYPKVLRDQVERLRLGQAVRFAGKLSPAEVVGWLRAANVFALASAREGCCNAVLEALSTGVPVIATKVGDNPYFVQEGVNGYLVPPDDAGALARGLEQGLARTWNASAIASGLNVGAWSDAAARVIAYMQERVAVSADVGWRS